MKVPILEKKCPVLPLLKNLYRVRFEHDDGETLINIKTAADFKVVLPVVPFFLDGQFPCHTRY